MPQPVWAVNRHDRDHKVYFPGRVNAETWVSFRDPDDWDIVDIPDDEVRRLWRGKRCD